MVFQLCIFPAFAEMEILLQVVLALQGLNLWLSALSALILEEKSGKVCKRKISFLSLQKHGILE